MEHQSVCKFKQALLDGNMERYSTHGMKKCTCKMPEKKIGKWQRIQCCWSVGCMWGMTWEVNIERELGTNSGGSGNVRGVCH